MLRALLNLCGRRSFSRRRPRTAAGVWKGNRFDSFMAQHNRRRVDVDLRDAALQGRRMMKLTLWFALLGGGAWVAVESARALSIF